MKNFMKTSWKWILISLVVVFVFLQWSGKTVIVLNNAYEEICEVHISTSPDISEWGRDWVPGSIPWPNSLDIHLPMYLTWFKPADERQLHLWAVDCDGVVINSTLYPEDAGHTFTWQVSKP